MGTLKKRQLPEGWYPVSKNAVLNEIRNFSREFLKNHGSKTGKYGGIIPHAGWYFSGNMAAVVMNSLKETDPELVILYGGHLPAGEAPLITIAEGWETPLGNMEIDVEFAGQIKEKYRLKEDVYPDNTLEIQLPLLKYFFPKAKLLALRLPASMEAAKLSESIVGNIQKINRKFIVFASTDLTHYGPNYDFSPAGENPNDWVRNNDKGFIELAIRLKTKELLKYAEKNQSACSSGAVAGLTAAVKMMKGQNGDLLSYKTSYEVMPSKSFVGYAGIVY